MKKLIVIPSFIMAFALLCTFSACRNNCIKGSGNENTENRKFGDFSRIEIQGAYTVNLKQDSSMGVSITGDDNLLKYIKTGVSDGKLHIYSKKNFCSKGAIVINIGIGKLESLSADGAVELKTGGKLNADNLKLSLSGANRITLDLNATNFSAEGSGANELFLSGQSAASKIKFTGSGKLHAFDFVVGDYDLGTTGASNCEINVLKTLKVSTMGASDIKYKGNPENIQNEKSGASKLTKVE
jgi:Putative auto-transporter adhesin, head GIN domain